MIKFGATKLSSIGKKGILTPDLEGYYTVVLGGLDIYNSAGEFYTSVKARELFEASSSFMRRVNNGALYAELGHPKMTPGMSYRDFLNRLMQIYDDKVCGHIKEVWLKEHHENKNIIAIMGKVKPHGPYSATLKDSLDNPNINTAFSIRAITEDVVIRGVNTRTLTNIFTWDMVIEPGIAIATKYSNPGLEQYEDLDTLPITKEQLVIAIEELKTNVATENSKNIIREIAEYYKVVDIPYNILGW